MTSSILNRTALNARVFSGLFETTQLEIMATAAQNDTEIRDIVYFVTQESWESSTPEPEGMSLLMIGRCEYSSRQTDFTHQLARLHS